MKTITTTALIAASSMLTLQAATLTVSTMYKDTTRPGDTISLVGDDLTITTEVGSGPSTTGAIGEMSQAFTLSGIGDYIEVTFLIDALAGNVDDGIGFGFFNTSADAITSDFDSGMNAAIGLYATAPYRTSGSGNRGGYQVQTAGTASFMNVDGLDMDGGDGVSEVASFQFPNGAGTHSFRLTYLAGGDIQMDMSWATADPTPFILSAGSVPTYTFDSIAFATQENQGQSNTFTDIVITAVPEPSTFLLVGLSFLAGFVTLRRKG